MSGDQTSQAPFAGQRILKGPQMPEAALLVAATSWKAPGMEILQLPPQLVPGHRCPRVPRCGQGVLPYSSISSRGAEQASMALAQPCLPEPESPWGAVTACKGHGWGLGPFFCQAGQTQEERRVPGGCLGTHPADIPEQGGLELPGGQTCTVPTALGRSMSITPQLSWGCR